jgi:hypothetical protein
VISVFAIIPFRPYFLTHLALVLQNRGETLIANDLQHMARKMEDRSVLQRCLIRHQKIEDVGHAVWFI